MKVQALAGVTDVPSLCVISLSNCIRVNPYCSGLLGLLVATPVLRLYRAKLNELIVLLTSSIPGTLRVGMTIPY